MASRTHRHEPAEKVDSKATVEPAAEPVTSAPQRPHRLGDLYLPSDSQSSPVQRALAHDPPVQGMPGRSTNARHSTSGLPEQLQSNIETISGHSLEGVRVFRGSSEPAQMHAHAFTRGTEIHLGPGQERHLPHEAWHVVQQLDGRVRADTMMGDVGVNTSSTLEQEADRMGQRALTGSVEPYSGAQSGGAAQSAPVVQGRFLRSLQRAGGMILRRAKGGGKIIGKGGGLLLEGGKEVFKDGVMKLGDGLLSGNLGERADRHLNMQQRRRLDATAKNIDRMLGAVLPDRYLEQEEDPGFGLSTADRRAFVEGNTTTSQAADIGLSEGEANLGLSNGLGTGQTMAGLFGLRAAQALDFQETEGGSTIADQEDPDLVDLSKYVEP